MDNRFVDKKFFLKQVDPIEVAEEYLSGKLRLPADKIKFDNIMITPDLELGKDYTSSIYEILDKNGETIRIITTDHDRWSGANSSDKKYLCNWCRLHQSAEPIIIPIKVEQINGNFAFHGTGNYCCFECAFADLKTKLYTGLYLRDLLYSNSENLLRFMYYIYTGLDNLVAAPDWILHEKNGGKLSDKDFFNSRHTYVKCPNLIMNVAKITHYQVSK